MKNRRGFTLVEILAVIFIIGLIIGIAVPNVIKTSNKIKNKSLYNKKEIIKKAATNYAKMNTEKIRKVIVDGGENQCTKEDSDINCWYLESDKKRVKYVITLNDLIKLDGYDAEINKDDLSKCNVEDPSKRYECLDDLSIIIDMDWEYGTSKVKLDESKLK